MKVGEDVWNAAECLPCLAENAAEDERSYLSWVFLENWAWDCCWVGSDAPEVELMDDVDDLCWEAVVERERFNALDLVVVFLRDRCCGCGLPAGFGCGI